MEGKGGDLWDLGSEDALIVRNLSNAASLIFVSEKKNTTKYEAFMSHLQCHCAYMRFCLHASHVSAWYEHKHTRTCRARIEGRPLRQGQHFARQGGSLTQQQGSPQLGQTNQPVHHENTRQKNNRSSVTNWYEMRNNYNCIDVARRKQTREDVGTSKK